jgi:predicted RNA-binding protein with PUA-like domain
MAHWLLKSEPDEFSITDLECKCVEPWDGIRNYQARNFIREMKQGDTAFFYHSSCKDIGIAGIMEIAGTYYEDPLAINKNSPYYDKRAVNKNSWSAIDVRFKQKFPKVLSLDALRNMAVYDQRLADLILIKKGNRLSVMPITDDQWQCIMENVAPF